MYAIVKIKSGMHNSDTYDVVTTDNKALAEFGLALLESVTDEINSVTDEDDYIRFRIEERG